VKQHNPTYYTEYTEQLKNRFKNGMLTELQPYKNFVVWKKTPDGKKIPFNPETGTLAKSNDPSTWSSLENALKALLKEEYDGIGFMFIPPFVGIDIDHCIVNGQLTPAAQKLVKTFDSYTEISKSGKGLHILIKGQLPEGRRKGNIEIYPKGRYFALTTRHMKGTPITIKERQTQLDNLYETLAPATRSRTTNSQNKTVFSLNASDTDVIEKAMNARNGATFRELWQGNITGHQSKSEADFILILRLLYWTNNDQEQTKRLFLQSGLADEKTLRPTNGTTYLDQSITNAISKRHK
jgi:primase-polymerase (primpol)-like protein